MPSNELVRLPDLAHALTAEQIIETLRLPGGCFYVPHNPAYLDPRKNKNITLEVSSYRTLLRHFPRTPRPVRELTYQPQADGFEWAPRGNYEDLRINPGLVRAAGKQATVFLLAWTPNRQSSLEARRLGEEFEAPHYSLHYCPPGMAIGQAPRALVQR